jgi:hypothetical protein
LSVNRSANGRPPTPGPVVRGTVSPARALLSYRRRPVTFTLGFTNHFFCLSTMNRHSALRFSLAAILASHAVTASSEPFNSVSNRFAIEFSSPWKRISLPDPSGELFLLCDEAACGPKALLSFGAYFDTNLKSGKVADFLRHANGNTIVQNVRSAPGVASVKILREGRARLGPAEAYEVLAEITLQNGQKRTRHTFMTFNAGYVYNVSLGCPPENHEKSLNKAQAVLAAFKFQ